MKILGDGNNNKKESKLQKAVLPVLLLVLVVGLGLFVYSTMNKGLNVEQEKEFIAMKEKYEGMGKKLTKEQYEKMEKTKEKPLAALTDEKGEKLKHDVWDGDVKAPKDEKKGENLSYKDNEKFNIKTEDRNEKDSTDLDNESKTELEEIQDGIEKEDGTSPEITEAKLAGQILEQYHFWERNIANDLGWGKDQYPDADYDATRTYIRELNSYMRGGPEPKNDMMMGLSDGTSNFKQAAFDGTSFDFIFVQEEVNQRMSGYFAVSPKFSQIYSVYVGKSDAVFDEAVADSQVLLNTDGGTFYAYIVFNGDDIILLDIA